MLNKLKVLGVGGDSSPLLSPSGDSSHRLKVKLQRTCTGKGGIPVPQKHPNETKLTQMQGVLSQLSWHGELGSV